MVRVQKKAHAHVERVLVFQYTEETTLADMTEAVAALGYIYPKWRFHHHGQEMDPDDEILFVDLLQSGEHLHLVDPFVGGLLLGGLAGGAIGYAVGKSSANKANNQQQ